LIAVARVGWKVAFALALLPTAAIAQVNAVAPPQVRSAQRVAILNAIRPAAELELGRNIEFVPSCVQVWKGWALVAAEPQRKGGRKIDRRILPDWDNRDGLTVTALLRFRYGRWNLVGHAIGATDVWYDGQAPRPLMRSACY
jgi:hypothetical protein